MICHMTHSLAHLLVALSSSWVGSASRLGWPLVAAGAPGGRSGSAWCTQGGGRCGTVRSVAAARWRQPGTTNQTHNISLLPPIKHSSLNINSSHAFRHASLTPAWHHKIICLSSSKLSPTPKSSLNKDRCREMNKTNSNWARKGGHSWIISTTKLPMNQTPKGVLFHWRFFCHSFTYRIKVYASRMFDTLDTSTVTVLTWRDATVTRKDDQWGNPCNRNAAVPPHVLPLTPPLYTPKKKKWKMQAQTISPSMEILTGYFAVLPNMANTTTSGFSGTTGSSVMLFSSGDRETTATVTEQLSHTH